MSCWRREAFRVPVGLASLRALSPLGANRDSAFGRKRDFHGGAAAHEG